MLFELVINVTEPSGLQVLINIVSIVIKFLVDSADDAAQSRSSSTITVTCKIIRFLVDDDRSANYGTSTDK